MRNSQKRGRNWNARPPSAKQNCSGFAPNLSERMQQANVIDQLHAAIADQQVLHLDYRDESGRTTLRDVEPLCLAFWGGAWTLGAWCRLREDFRSFRPDRIASFTPTGETFVETPARGLAAYVRAMGGATEATQD